MSDTGRIQVLTDPLPRALRDQVYSYVSAVEDAADAIFDDAGLEKTEQAVEVLRVLAAIRKIVGIVSMGYWAIDNVLASGDRYAAKSIRIGGTIYSKDTEAYVDLKQMLSDLSDGLAERGILDHVKSGSYSDALREISNGPRWVTGFVAGVLKRNDSVLRDLANHQTAFLELAAFAAGFEHYRLKGLTPKMIHPPGGRLTVKTSTRGHPSRFSRVEVASGTHAWEIHMNLPVQGPHGKGIFCVDIGVVRQGAVPTALPKKKGAAKWKAARNADLITFAEVKKLVVYPMLLAQFIGIVHEILPRFLGNRRPRHFRSNRHFEPALLALGNFSGNAGEVVESFHRRRFSILVIPAFDVKLGRIRAGSAEGPFDIEGDLEDGSG